MPNCQKQKGNKETQYHLELASVRVDEILNVNEVTHSGRLESQRWGTRSSPPGAGNSLQLRPLDVFPGKNILYFITDIVRISITWC